MGKKLISLLMKNTTSDMSVRERMFRLLIAIGGITVVLATLECVLVLTDPIAEIPMVILAVVIAIGIVLTYKYRKVELAETMVGIVITLVTLPSMFFMSGGPNSGVGIWLVLGYVYSFLLFTGVRLAIFVGLNLLVDVAIYAIAYQYPNLVVPIEGAYSVYVDSLFSLVGVSAFCGILICFQVYLYEKESEMVKKQAQELEEASRVQDAFFTNMSHEIRTPINSIMGLNEMILRETENPEIAEYARDIQASGKMLLDLVNDILDMSKLKQNKMEVVNVEYQPQKLLREVVEMLQIRMNEKKLDFFVNVDNQLPSVLYGDARHLQQILINLLTNAAKYTNEGRVVLNIETETIGENEVLLNIAVKDTGIGIRRENLNQLFESFRRVNIEQNVNIEGSGLGLSITKRLVDLMDGEIKVDSIYTKGSTFTVTVKQKIVDAAPIGNINFLQHRKSKSGPYYEHTFESPEARILLAEDNAMNALVIRQLLRDTKVQVDVAASGTECIAMTKKKYYHVILMDYMMPDMNGADTLQIIRKQENGLCNETPAILLTASNLADAQNMPDVYGFQAFLEKPIHADKLESEILHFLPADIIEFRRVAADEKPQENMGFRNRKKRMLITTDCVCDLPERILAKYDIRVMYLYVKMGEARFADTKEIDSDSMAQILQEPGVTLQADSVSVEEYEDFFAETLAEAENVLHISMAAHSGKTYQAAVAAAKSFDHVQVMDSGQVSSGQGLLVLKAAQMQYAGYGIEAIRSELEQLKQHVVCQFLLPNANEFYKNGYASATQARWLRMLYAHPIVAERASYMRVQSVRFGNLNRAWSRFIKHLLHNKRQIDSEIIFVAYVGLSYEQQEYLLQLIHENFEFKQVVLHKASLSSSCNSGINTIGVAFFKKVG